MKKHQGRKEIRHFINQQNIIHIRKYSIFIYWTCTLWQFEMVVFFYWDWIEKKWWKMVNECFLRPKVKIRTNQRLALYTLIYMFVIISNEKDFLTPKKSSEELFLFGIDCKNESQICLRVMHFRYIFQLMPSIP